MTFINPYNAIALRIENREDALRAIRIAQESGRHYIFPDSKTIIMDASSRELFEGLEYEVEEVVRPDEVSNEEINEIRRRYMFGKE